MRIHKTLPNIIAFALVGLLVFSQGITLDHYREFHREGTSHSHHDKKEKHHSDTCFICHTQATPFILSDFHFSFTENTEISPHKILYFNNIEFPQNVNRLYSGRAPPFWVFQH